MKEKLHRTVLGFGVTAGLAMLTAGCGNLATQGTAPVQVVIDSLQAASGATPDTIGGTLNSDVVTNVRRQVGAVQVEVPTICNDFGLVRMRLVLKDPGVPGVTNVPSPINEVTIKRYRVTFRRADGRNTQGVDVPFAFDSAVTFTIPAQGVAEATFELVRHVAKEEAPLAALRVNNLNITTLAEVSFFGADQAGHDVIASGTIGVTFANFGDPN